MKWNKEAEARIKKAPLFIRGFARKKAEEMAKSLGKDIVDMESIDRAKESNKEHCTQCGGCAKGDN